MDNTFVIWTNNDDTTSTAHLMCGNCKHEMELTNVSINGYEYDCNTCNNHVTKQIMYPYSKYRPENSSLCN